MIDTLVRPKLHGIPCEIKNGFVPEEIKNFTVREILGGLPNFVGEIVVGVPQAPDCYERSKEFVEDERALVPFIFWVYDMRTNHPYDLRARLGIAEGMIGACRPNIQFVEHKSVESEDELEKYRSLLLEDGWDTMLLRIPYGTFGTEDTEVTTHIPS